MTVHYVIDGPADGEVALFSGSLGSDVSMWDPQVEALVDAGYRVVRCDHPGHGRSPAPDGPSTLADLGADLVAVIGDLGVGRVHFVGLSLGGMLGMWLGAHAPERIASLTLCCTSADIGPREPWARRAALVRAEGTGAVADAVVERWFTEGWRARHPERVAHYRELIAATPAEGYASCCAAIEHMDLDLSPISAPTLVIAGAQDPATPPEHGERIAEGINGARLEVLDPAAHLANVEQPDKVNQLIIDHLRSVR